MKIILIFLSFGLIPGLSACNTVKGVGKDTERAGEIIQKEAEKHIDDDKKNQHAI